MHILLHFFYILGKVCELKKRSGNYLVGDKDFERAYKTSVGDCESECLNDEKCRVMFYINAFCFIVYKDVPPVPYTGISLYFDKVCKYSKYTKTCFVTTHLEKKYRICLKFCHSFFVFKFDTVNAFWIVLIWSI